MGTSVAVRQGANWTMRNAHSAVVATQMWRCRPQPLRCLCTPHSTLQRAQHNSGVGQPARKVDTELSLRSFLDMGFTETQAEHLHDAASRVKAGSAAGQVMATLSVLFVLGLNPSSVIKVLQKCPELYTVREPQLQQRVGNLRKLGLVEGSLQRVVVFYPRILMVPVKAVKNVVLFLRGRCLFTTQQVTDILRESPAIVLENMAHLEYKFQYVYFRMGVKQEEIVKSKLFRTSLDDVRHRHSFLERRGLYQTPDKNGQTSIVNPKLESVLCVDEDTFLTQLAKASAEEYDVFKRLVAREWKEEDMQLSSTEAESDDDDDEEEERLMEDEEAETAGRHSYRKRTKRTLK